MLNLFLSNQFFTISYILIVDIPVIDVLTEPCDSSSIDALILSICCSASPFEYAENLEPVLLVAINSHADKVLKSDIFFSTNSAFFFFSISHFLCSSINSLLISSNMFFLCWLNKPEYLNKNFNIFI